MFRPGLLYQLRRHCSWRATFGFIPSHVPLQTCCHLSIGSQSCTYWQRGARSSQWRDLQACLLCGESNETIESQTTQSLRFLTLIVLSGPSYAQTSLVNIRDPNWSATIAALLRPLYHVSTPYCYVFSSKQPCTICGGRGTV